MSGNNFTKTLVAVHDLHLCKWQKTANIPADEDLASSEPRLQAVKLYFRSCRASLLLRRIGAAYPNVSSSSSCCAGKPLPDIVLSVVSGASAKSERRLSGLLEASFERNICSQVPAFARDSTPLRTSGGSELCERPLSIVAEPLLAFLPARMLPFCMPSCNKPLCCLLDGFDKPCKRFEQKVWSTFYSMHLTNARGYRLCANGGNMWKKQRLPSGCPTS